MTWLLGTLFYAIPGILIAVIVGLVFARFLKGHLGSERNHWH